MNRKRKERLSKNAKDRFFIKKLSKELREQEKDHQAAPRFWVIMDYKWLNADSNYSDESAIYDTDGSRWTEVEEFIKSYVEYNSFDELVERHGLESMSEFLNIDALDEIADFLNDEFNDDEYTFVYEQEIEYVKENTMFLTKEEAKEHLKLNKHHYTRKAHTYAMTAWRAPKVERLLKILESVK